MQDVARQRAQKGVYRTMSQDKSNKANRNHKRESRAGQDVVEGGIWLTADSLNQLMFNHLHEVHGGKVMDETLWMCDQLRAGQLYNRMMFDTQDEAKKFAERMQQMEPDQTFRIEPVSAAQVWN